MPPFTLHKQLEAESAFVRDLAFSQLRLQNQKIVPWLILVPRRSDVIEIYKLSANERAQLMDEIVQASRAVEELYKPFKINIAALGNVVPQIHVHVIGRYENDPVWPAPVWGRLQPAPYEPEALEKEKQRLNEFFDRFTEARQKSGTSS